MAKRFELNLTHRLPDNSFQVKSFNKIESDNFIELLAQFMLVIASVMQEIEIENRVENDDIPF